MFEAAEREGHHMRLVVPGESTSVREVGCFGKIYQIEAPRAPLNPEYRVVLPHRYLFPGTALQRILNEEEPDLVEVSDKYAIHWLAGLLRTRRLPGVRTRPTIVGTSHERMDENVRAYLTESKAGQRLSRWYMKWLYFPMFDHHITVSEHTAEELIQASRGHKVRRGIWVAGMGVDCDRFTPARKSAGVRMKLQELARCDGETTILLFAGRLAPEKNLPLLMETAARLPSTQYRLAIAGGGILEELLRAQCGARGLQHVVFLGHVGDRDTLADYFANADIFVHPNDREPFGITPLEAMASGLALVAPNAGGVTSYATEANAWLAKADAASFADAITAAVKNRAERARRTQTALETASEHRWDRITSRYLQLYRELHAATRGLPAVPAIAPRFYSTPGDFLGRELVGL
jgi:alpha-1,6-mannosyltransferase